jgi:CheY-like chemotaxis protein
MEYHQHVLIVEDDENDAFFIQRAFQHVGVIQAPSICKNVKDAIRYLEGKGEYADRQRFPFPNVLITDLKMPGETGFNLLEWIRDHPYLRVIPTVIVSSSSMPDDIKYAYCLGANAYLTKRTDPTEFREMFTSLLRFWELCEVPDLGGPTCEELAKSHQTNVMSSNKSARTE